MRETFKGSTSHSEFYMLVDSTTGLGKTGLTYSSMTGSYTRTLGARVSITMATQTVTGAFSSGGFVEIDATNQPGLYRFDIPDAAFVTGADSVVVTLKATGVRTENKEFRLVNLNNQVAYAPNAAADGVGGLPISDAGGLDMDALATATTDIQSRLPAALSGGKMDSVVPDTQKVDLNTIKTQPVTLSGGVTIPASTLASTTNITDAQIAIAAAIAALNDLSQAEVTGGAYALDTDANGRVRIVDGIGVGELDTLSGTVLLRSATQASIDAIEADTNELQTNQGNWLTATGFSTHTPADVRTELATELARIDVATSTRQATVPNLANVVTMAAQFSTMIIVDGVVYDFTAAALAAGPSSSGLTAQETRDAMKLAPTAGDPAAGSIDKHLDDLDTAVDLLAGAAGPGGIAWEVTVNDSEGDPIGDVGCWVSTDSAGTNVIAGTLYTTEFGIVTFMLNAGTYYLWRNSTSHDFTNPTVMTVA